MSAESREAFPWDHPLRAEAERLVQRYHDYAQTHLPSASKYELVEMILEFVQQSNLSGPLKTYDE